MILKAFANPAPIGADPLGEVREDAGFGLFPPPAFTAGLQSFFSIRDLELLPDRSVILT